MTQNKHQFIPTIVPNKHFITFIQFQKWESKTPCWKRLSNFVMKSAYTDFVVGLVRGEVVVGTTVLE